MDYQDAVKSELKRIGVTEDRLPDDAVNIMGLGYLYGFLSSLPEGMSVEEFDREMAVQLQAERAVRGLPLQPE